MASAEAAPAGLFSLRHNRDFPLSRLLSVREDVSSDDPKLELCFSLHVLDADMHHGDAITAAAAAGVGGSGGSGISSMRSPGLSSFSSSSRFGSYGSPLSFSGSGRKRLPFSSGGTPRSNYNRVEEKILGGRRRSSSGASSASSSMVADAAAAASAAAAAAEGGAVEDGFVTMAVVVRFRGGAAMQHAWANAIRLAAENLPDDTAIFNRSHK